MSERFPQVFWGMVALAVGLLGAAAFGAGALRDARRAGDAVEVTGSARRPIRSDFVVWRVSTASQGPTLQDAMGGLQGNSQRIRAWLRSRGVPDDAVTMQPVETEPMYRMLDSGVMTGDLMGYRLTQRFEVRSADVDGMTALSQRSSELINEGVPVVASAPEYLFTQLDSLRVEMLSAATEDARRRAEAIATSAGAEIGGVRSARMGVFQITPRNSTQVADYGINDTSSLEKDITAVVRVTFAMD